jgi:hypothetical protein
VPLWVPPPSFGWSFDQVGATRIAAAWGATVTPAQNAKSGAWAQLLSAANVSKDVFGIWISFNSNATSTAARDTIVDIGVDPAGGTSYTVLIPDLLASSAAPATTSSGGIHYFFPIWIKAGSTVAARASVNNATVGTLRARARIVGEPRRLDNVRVGTKVKAYGITAASSTGTAITAGTTSEGAWTSLGTIAAGDNPWFWQLGMGVNNGTITAVAYTGDLGIGDASNKAIVIENRVWNGSTTEQFWDDGVCDQSYYQAQDGDIVYGRLQASGTAITGLSLAAYGVI